jgi:purine-binding chemotaxis protein CheW
MLHVVFKVGESEYVVAAESVLYMESFTGATAVPGAPVFVAGLVQIRQRVVPLVDLRVRFGLAPAEHGLAQRVIVVQVDDRAVGLLVDGAREVIDVPVDAIQSPPELIATQSQGFVRAVAAVKDRLLMVIDLARVIGPDTLAPHPEDIDDGSAQEPVKENVHAH